jgi:hypothetical protein
MINLIFFILGAVGGWFLKFAFDFYRNFKDVEQKRAESMEDILLKFKMLEEFKKYGEKLRKIGQEDKKSL